MLMIDMESSLHLLPWRTFEGSGLEADDRRRSQGCEGWRTPSTESLLSCRRGRWCRQSQQPPERTSLHTWQQSTWMQHQPTAASSLTHIRSESRSQFIHSLHFYSASTTAQKRFSQHSMDTVSEFHTLGQQATASEGLAQGHYVAARAEFEPTTLRTKGDESNQWATMPQTSDPHFLISKFLTMAEFLSFIQH